jgi:hypothetical protein
MPTDRLQSGFAVGSIVNIPIRVTAIGGTPSQPTVTGVTVYKGFDDNTDSVGPVDAIQVVEDK